MLKMPDRTPHPPGSSELEVFSLLKKINLKLVILDYEKQIIGHVCQSHTESFQHWLFTMSPCSSFFFHLVLHIWVYESEKFNCWGSSCRKKKKDTRYSALLAVFSWSNWCKSEHSWPRAKFLSQSNPCWKCFDFAAGYRECCLKLQTAKKCH